MENDILLGSDTSRLIAAAVQPLINEVAILVARVEELERAAGLPPSTDSARAESLSTAARAVYRALGSEIASKVEALKPLP